MIAGAKKLLLIEEIMLSRHRRVNILKSCELEVSVPLSEVTPELLP